MAQNSKLRYAALTKEQQAEFDSWQPRQQRYALYRAQGIPKAEAYMRAGYAQTDRAGQNGNILETRTKPMMREIIAALQGLRQKYDVLVEHSEISKEVDKKTTEKLEKELQGMLYKVPENSPVFENKFDVGDITVEQARNIQFFRRIANGEYKNVKIVTKYDKDGNKLGTTVEESSDLDTRIKAQKEVMRMVGINDVVELGKVEAQNINIMIVDASKKNDEQEKLDIKGDIKEVDGKIEIVKEEKSNG